MIKPDWDVFKAKFSENPQYHFEWFCYLLFCKEFDRPYGIFRYKNQSAIETNPIEVDGDEIGFQAKFYDASLSSHKDDLLVTLIKAKRDYPDIKELILYTNQEWGQGYNKSSKPAKAKKPAGQVAVEDKAKKLEIKLEWRTLSYFESSFVSIECEKISKNFFSDDGTVFKFISQQEMHTRAILENIHSSMSYQGDEFSVDRDDVYESLYSCEEQMIILSGVGGVGKTVEIKRLYKALKSSIPFFAIKATELELSRLDDLSSEGSVYNFVDFYGDSDRKIFVIDSAEKLLDLSNQDPAKEFINLLISNGWQVIFTTRDHYFDDLNFLCMAIYRLTPLKIHIKEIDESDLNNLSLIHKFDLPSDVKLIELLKIPLYLSEYLSIASDIEAFDYSSFKRKIWDSKVKKGVGRREQTFISLAKRRVSKGSFLLIPEDNELDMADELARDGLLGYENSAYFIAHDIYEEWALEKYISSEFSRRASTGEFFENVGDSLAVRRSFRGWVSEKLLLNDEEVKVFLEALIDDDSVGLIWRDEIIVSILLSDLSEVFFEKFEDRLLEDSLELTKRICFMLRIACKEVDDDVFKQLCIIDNTSLPYENIFTRPKGSGWSSLVKFISNNFNKIGAENLGFILPVLYEWNSKFKSGETTRSASIIALDYYKWIYSEDIYYESGGAGSSLIEIIAYGTSEIKGEIKGVINEVVKKNFTGHRDPYIGFCKHVLTKLDGIHVAKELPEETIALAKTFWIKDYSKDTDPYSNHRHKREFRYGITDEHDFQYFPASALQTPVYWLLQSSLKQTVDFILEFSNEVTENIVRFYGREKFNVSKVQIEGLSVEFYIDANLWVAYREAGDAPYLFSSILMALEKFFLTYADQFKDDELECWLIYMLKNTKSSAICSVVASIVLANHGRTFNVAKILFGIKDFFSCDLQRQVFDRGLKSQLLGFGGLSTNKFLEDERMSACDDKHRGNSLESLFLQYQIFSTEPAGEIEATARQEELWSILDNYYKDLIGHEDTDDVKSWRICLARMDRRKMKIEVEEVDDGVALTFTPELDSSLKEFSDKSQERSSSDYKYLALKLWSKNKISLDDDYKKYEMYESSPQVALEEAKEIINQLLKLRESGEESRESESFFLLNRSTPAYVCGTLIKYHESDLEKHDIEYCKDFVLDSLKVICTSAYSYQVGDGIDACVYVLPDLLEMFPDDREGVKLFLLISLFKDYPIDMLGGSRFYDLAINAIHSLWDTKPDDAESLLLGCLSLRCKYFELMHLIREENYKRGEFDTGFDDFIPRFLDENKGVIDSMISNNLDLSVVDGIKDLDLGEKCIALRLIPNSPNDLCKKVFSEISVSAAEYLLSDGRDDKPDFTSKSEFLKKFTLFILQLPKEEISTLLKPFLDNFKSSEGSADLLEQFVLAQYSSSQYDNFWYVWGLFQPLVTQLVGSGYISYRKEKIVKKYLFSQNWKESAKDWHTFKPANIKFFKQISVDLAPCKTTLYSIARLLNDIGRGYESEGVSWLANIIRNNNNIENEELETNTIYYITMYIKRYLYENRTAVKHSVELKCDVLVVLNLLINKGEVSGYLLRESIV
jgi:hypothetical protein